jgi:hypothetical protein
MPEVWAIATACDGGLMDAHEIAGSMLTAKRDIDEAMLEYRRCINLDAEASDNAKRAVARATITCRESQPKATVGVIEAMVDLETADVQKAARLAEGLKRSAGMAVDNARQWLSSLQSLASLTKAEAQLAAWEPKEVA